MPVAEVPAVPAETTPNTRAALIELATSQPNGFANTTVANQALDDLILAVGRAVERGTTPVVHLASRLLGMAANRRTKLYRMLADFLAMIVAQRYQTVEATVSWTASANAAHVLSVS